MRRTLVALLAVALAAPAGASVQERPPLRATLAACEAGPTAAERFAVFTGSMPALVGTQRMAMRFDLMERRDGSRRWRRVRAPKFGRWERSTEAGAAGFIYTKRVERLKQAARYRAVVRFRWTDAEGRTQRTRRRVTRSCVQPSQRPDLRVQTVGIAPGDDASTRRYLVTVVNEGHTAARAFTVGMVVAGEEATRDVPGLAPGDRTTVELTGPRCGRDGRIAVQVDVRGVVRESDEADNRSIRPCDGR
jgi:hypothetical protein